MEVFTEIDQDPYDDAVLGEFIQSMVDPVDNEMLTTFPSVEEIKRAVFDMEPSSSPSPDGFGGSFYQACWDIIALDVTEVVRYFFTTIHIPFGLNSSFVTLILKKPGANRTGEDFHALYHWDYSRLLADVLFGVPIFRGASRTCHLAPLADSIISKFSKWKGHSFSLAGRKCLINLVIAASLVYSMIMYYWPRTLLKKIETIMRNFLWTGDITRRNTSCMVSWARVCSPLDEDGLGVRSIRHANDSFICKLAWDILSNKTPDISLLHDKYITVRGRPRSYGRPSSIWPGIRRHLGRLVDEKIGIPHFFVVGLTYTISDFFFDGHWHFDQDFFMKHTDIVRDILSIHVSRCDDSRVWGRTVSGQLTSRLAYDLLRAAHPRVSWSSWIWGQFIPPCRSTLIWRAVWGKLPSAGWLGRFGIHGPTACFLYHNASESLDHIFAHWSFTRSLFGRVTALFDLSLYYDIGFLDVFL
ncbi:hypothetical protein ACS0TY_033871 [Phlomoides rotata]